MNVHQDYVDLGRRRRSQRRNRTATVAILAVAAVVATASVRGSLSADPAPPPAQPAPTRDGLGLTAPLIAPDSPLDVKSLGFRVGPVGGFEPEGLGAGWSVDDEGQTVTLRWTEVADEVEVTVLYQGEGSPLNTLWGDAEAVTIHGAPGNYGENAGGPFLAIDGDFEAALVWEYAPESWASVSVRSDRGDPGPQRLRAALVEVAEAVADGGDLLRLPIQMRSLPSPMPDVSTLSGVGVHKGSSGWEADVQFGTVRITAGPGAVPEACQMYGGGIETFTYRGHAGCLAGGGATDQPPAGTAFNFVDAIALQIGGTIRAVVPRDSGDAFSSNIDGWKQLLAELTVANLDDESTWVDIEAALGT